MNAYTVSHLALDAGVSVHVVRDYMLRGLLRPVAWTTGGYGLFDAAALQRLCFVRAAFEAGIGLDSLARLCRALDAADGDGAAAQLAVLRQLVERRREAQLHLESASAVTGIADLNLAVHEAKAVLAGFRAAHQLQQLHLFVRAPSHFAMALGHRLNGLGAIQLYDWVDTAYVPTAVLS